MKAQKLLSVSLFLLSCAIPSWAFAGDSWKELREGVSYLYRPSTRLHVVKIELGNSSLKVRTTLSNERAQTPRQFARVAKAFIAMNADFYDPKHNYLPLGIAIGEGELWPLTPFKREWGFLACDASNRCAIQYAHEKPEIDASWKSVVGGRDQIVTDGKAWTRNDDFECGPLCTTRANRSAVALTQENQTLFLAVSEGRMKGAPGLLVSELASELLSLGAYDALHLDGGGSSQLVIDGKLVSARPDNEPSERPVANHIGIVVESPNSF